MTVDNSPLAARNCRCAAVALKSGGPRTHESPIRSHSAGEIAERSERGRLPKRERLAVLEPWAEPERLAKRESFAEQVRLAERRKFPQWVAFVAPERLAERVAFAEWVRLAGRKLFPKREALPKRKPLAEWGRHG